MYKLVASFAIAASMAAPLPVLAQSALPGSQEISQVIAGSYQVDTHHTFVTWTVNHMGLSPLSGMIAASGGTLELDPAAPEKSKVEVEFDVASMSTAVPAFTKHLLNEDFFEVEKHPRAKFVSTSVAADGEKAKITGDLTIKGETRQITLDAEFFGAGLNPMSKKREVGFTASARINRSDFGLDYGVPAVTPDEVELEISAAFSPAD